MADKEYYKSQIDMVKGDYGEFEQKIKIIGNDKETKWLNLNRESAREIINFLQDKFSI